MIGFSLADAMIISNCHHRPVRFQRWTGCRLDRFQLLSESRVRADWIARPEESWLRALSPPRSVVKGVVLPTREQRSYTVT